MELGHLQCVVLCWCSVIKENKEKPVVFPMARKEKILKQPECIALTGFQGCSQAAPIGYPDIGRPG